MTESQAMLMRHCWEIGLLTYSLKNFVSKSAMQFMNTVQKVLTTKILTPEVEEQINDLLWSNSFDQADKEALIKLIDALSNGTVQSAHQN